MRVPRIPLWVLILAVVAIGIASGILSPDDRRAATLLQVADARRAFESLKPRIEAFRQARDTWPAQNGDIGLPDDGFIGGRDDRAFRMQPDGGVLVTLYRNRCADEACRNSTRVEIGALTLRPALGAAGDIVWVCGNATAPAGYTVAGLNRTTLRKGERELPPECER